jgi:hypothetical protein
MDERRAYGINITVNGIQINRVVVGTHYEKKHTDSMNDDIILDLVELLDGKEFIPEKTDGKFQYFKSEPLFLDNKKYRLIWLLEDDQIYIGVINAFRRR